MTLHPVDNVPLSGKIHRQLMDGILDGTLTGVLPSERELAETFGVNRHAVREAIKRLQQGRLVEVSQGGATRVLSIPDHAGFDLLPELVSAGGARSGEVSLGILELRACIGAEAARLCAQRSPGVGEQLVELLPNASMDTVELDEKTVAYWTALVTGADSLPFRLVFNTLIEGLAAVDGSAAGGEFIEILRDEARQPDGLTKIAEAITAGDTTGAEQVARELLSGTVEAHRRSASKSQRTKR